MFGAGYLGAMQNLDFFAAVPQLLHHVIEVAAEVSDFVVTIGEADGDIEIAVADLIHLLLQFDHGALNQVGQTEHGRGADGDGSRSGDDHDSVAFGITQRDGREREEQQSRKQHEAYG